MDGYKRYIKELKEYRSDVDFDRMRVVMESKRTNSALWRTSLMKPVIAGAFTLSFIAALFAFSYISAYYSHDYVADYVLGGVPSSNTVISDIMSN